MIHSKDNAEKIISDARKNMILNESWAFQLSLKDTLQRLKMLGYEDITIFDVKRKFHQLDKQFLELFNHTTTE